MMENLTSGNQSDGSQNTYDLMDKLEAVAVHIIQPAIGLAVVATNIALFFFHKHRANQSKITLLFLSNLTFSDILFGGIFLIRFIVVTGLQRFETQVCRFVVGPVSVISVTVSAWSILLISTQVCV